ncbi:MAG: HD family hydrolase [Candidatus Wukongarchaeota archaeon]|nr:HD family hydrolase [Candidatus Wukongarchaeota archaeon]
MIDFLLKIGRLKRYPRMGWIVSGVNLAEIETVGAHSFRTALIALILSMREKELSRNEIDIRRVLEMALLHDFSEAVLQDIDRRVIPYFGEEFKQLKKRAEKRAVEEIISSMGDHVETKRAFLGVIEDYMLEKSKESKIVQVADRLEVLIQAFEYEQLGYPKKLFEDFWSNIVKEVENSGIKSANKLLEELLRSRNRKKGSC